MPFTFSHPAVILPLTKSKYKLSFTALVAGSIVPDYEFFFQMKEVENIGHHILGFFILDIPLAYLFCYLFHHVLRNYTILNLPTFFKKKCINIIHFNWSHFAKENKTIVFISIIIGIISHLFLDAFTHHDGFFVIHFSALQHIILLFNKRMPIFFILQILFSFLGLVYVGYTINKLPNQMVTLKSYSKENTFYWISILTTTLIILFFRIILMPDNNSFWSLVLGILGALHYAWLLITILFNYMKPMKYITAFVILFVFCNKGFAQQNYQQQKDKWIQKASELRTQENYVGAIQQLDSILRLNNKDAGILLFKGDLQLQAKQFKNAVSTYKLLLPLHFETTIAKINLSYALFMSHKNVNALTYAKDAYKNDTLNANAIINYFNAMLWNLKIKQASVFLNKEKKHLTQKDELVLKARLNTTNGDFISGLQFYDSLVKRFTEKYYVQEYSEVMLGKKKWNKASALMKSKEALFSKNEYNGFVEKAKAYQIQNVGTEFVYFTDVAKNTRIENNFWWQQKEAVKYRFMVKVGASNIKSAQNDKTTAYNATVHIEELFSTKITGQTDVNAQQINVYGGEKYAAITGKQLIKYQPTDHKMVSLFYSTDILNYTAALLGNNIRSNNIGYVTHFLFGGKTGLYSEGSVGSLTDNNTRSQVFFSLYRLLRTEPTIKTGINFSGLHFSDSTITKYFSPNSFLSSEAFLDYTSPISSKLFIQSQAAAGLQKIEQQAWQNSLRFQTEIGYQTKHCAFSLKYQTSNTASVSGTGYSFNWFTGKFLFKW